MTGMAESYLFDFQHRIYHVLRTVYPNVRIFQHTTEVKNVCWSTGRET